MRALSAAALGPDRWDRTVAGKIVEPSIGSGAFLIPIIERLIASARMPWSRA
jgi:hypothetical protein